jgi:hypothetical protein
MDTKQYLEYLDKEMTIMGILSAISVATPAGILSTVLADHKEVSPLVAGLLNAGQFFIFAGSGLCLVAALCFYKQRSTLAWYYGQICLTGALTDEKSVSAELGEWLREADSWETWWPYSWGFTSLITATAEYLLALLFLLAPPRLPSLFVHLHVLKIVAFSACPVAAGAVAALQWYVLTHYKFSDDYWKDFRKDIRGRLQGKKMLPHEGVYTRLKPSPIHGVGVFAICRIPKGTYVFEPDDDTLVSVCADETKDLPPEVRRLYEDFCVLKDDTYECPASLNKLTPAWFLNKSKHPNIAADLSLKFYAIRDVEAGEELTADYDAYSDGGSGGSF